MILIFYYSSQTAVESSNLSGGITRRFLESILNISKIKLSETDRLLWLEIMEIVIRKAAHMAEYAVLGIAVAYPVYVYGKRGKTLILWSELICIIYAATDEFHQLFVPGRAGLISDVIIDGLGALIGCYLYLIIKKGDRHRRKKR